MITILVIDDNEAYRATLLEVLELESYLVLEAENGLMGLRMIQQYSPNLILCDVDMPVMNGLELLGNVKANPLLASIPFIMMTGHSAELTRTVAQGLGEAAYLIKPITIAELLSTIASFLSYSSQ